ncbi:MAG: 3-keto-5-aminohexanoate cleavage protein [Alphaproteobacteria bacterium]|nr:3-keto-5-aminohexanoate cleavage protein [Alphaproteobacteria bacterium]
MPAPLILAVAPNGARRTKADHPALPILPDELARAAAGALEGGAAMIHLHVRGADGGHTLDVGAYRAAIAAIRASIGERLVIQATSEAVGIYDRHQQMAMVRELRPEAVSIAIREIVPDAASERDAAEFFAFLARERVQPQFILYSDADLARLRDLRQRGVVPFARPFVLFVLGRYSPGQRSEPADLLAFLAPFPDDLHWSVCAFGARENACALAAAAFGGHARVGFENNLFLADGRIAADNADLVRQVAAGARMLGRPLASADETRGILA